ncbi:hypothetical protein C7212DRAFT_350108 [Tuber magnatum]|uniref:Uncharacterized protein n=1 Tax=Tuber magnatum TaxID=42249 RepID=A0A317SZM6_9PEZI|nr:hypothetical protein C7212DRAFT_350108 [Tuber magnatum]
MDPINEDKGTLSPMLDTHISLINVVGNVVATGPPQSLYSLNLNQNRVPFAEREVHFTNRFLPISAPGLTSQNLTIPVFHTSTGQDLRDGSGNESIISALVNMITQATHILDFSPGGIFGLGVLSHHNKDGTGVRIIIVDACEGANNEVGYKPELFDRDSEHAVEYEDGESFVDAKFLECLDCHLTVLPWDFVVATMNTGYQIELADGGYYNATGLTAAFQKIEQNTIPRAAMVRQFPLLQHLRSAGILIKGLTIGARVPSIEVTNEYGETIGLKQISFKPGSSSGHHSFEDFHQPILQMYACIQRCGNIALVAGSGFGGAEDTDPYLTGAWSEKFKYPPMPFDGEAHTGSNAKKATCEAEGLDDKDWKTYMGPTGGVITLRSEMGEPIHKLATRGLDRIIFSLAKAKRLVELKKQCDYIIKHLNADFQTTWFGRDSNGEAMDLEDMTYAEAVCRMVELKYLTGDFIGRIEERFTRVKGQASLLQNYPDFDDPFATTKKILAHYPEANTRLINAQDAQHSLLLCQWRGQKPVTFVPSLEENFRFWFKKDSVWQSEDHEAAVDQDIGRSRILQGPMAAKHPTVVNEPIKDILDGIHNRHIAALIMDVHGRDQSAIPDVEYHFSGWRNKFTYNPIRRIFAPAHGIVVEITNTGDPTKAIITSKEKNQSGGCYVKTVEIRMLWFGDGKVPLDAAVTDVFDGGHTQVTRQAIADFIHAVWNNGEASSSDLGKLSTLGWILPLWLGGKLSSKQSSQRRLTAIFSSWFTSPIPSACFLVRSL